MKIEFQRLPDGSMNLILEAENPVEQHQITSLGLAARRIGVWVAGMARGTTAPITLIEFKIQRD